MDPINKVRDDFNPARLRSSRPSPSIAYIVLHDMEVHDLAGEDLSAERVGRFFQSSTATGSSHLGIDRDTTQRYLNDPWAAAGVRGFNAATKHYEQAGRASWTYAQWMAEKTMLRRTAWQLSRDSRRYGIPLVFIGRDALRKYGKTPGRPIGVTTHAEATYAFHDSTHTDPGPNFPIVAVMRLARAFRPYRRRLVLGVVGNDVLVWARRLEDLGYSGFQVNSSLFGPGKVRATRRFQDHKGLPVTGVVDVQTWTSAWNS